MPKLHLIAVAACLFAAPLPAKPLITSSEATLARICLKFGDTPERVLAACDGALIEPGVTEGLRADLAAARGDALAALDRQAEAEGAFRAALASNPNSTDGLNGLGWSLRAQQREDEAYEAFGKSLAVDVSADALAGRAATGRSTGAVDGDEARKMLEAALSISPGDVWVQREIGWSYFEDEDYSAAREWFGKAAAGDGTDVNAEYGLGRVALLLDEPEAALEHFNALLAVEGDNESALLYRMVTLRALDRNAQALREAERYIADHPDDTGGYVQKGRALLALQRRGEALKTYEDAEALLGPSNTIAYWHADALSWDGQMEAALAKIDEALALEGAGTDDLILKSYIALELKRYPLARRAAEKALETGANDPWAQFYVAISLIHDGKADEGLTRFDAAIAAGLPADQVGFFAKELISEGKWVQAAQLRLKY